MYLPTSCDSISSMSFLLSCQHSHKLALIIHLCSTQTSPRQKQIVHQFFFVCFPDEAIDLEPRQYFFSNFQVRAIITLLWLFLSIRKSVSMRKNYQSRIRNLCFSPLSATKYVLVARCLLILCLMDKVDKNTFLVYSMTILIWPIPTTS